MKTLHKACLRLCLLALAMTQPMATMGQGRELLRRPHYGGNEQRVLDTQGWVMFDQIKKSLKANPPCDRNASEPRRLALLNLDALLHNYHYDKSLSLNDFIATQVSSVVDALNHPATDGALEVYKVYNDGFVVRSASTCIAFDLCGREGKMVPDSLMQRIAGHCDALFISHVHTDHADTSIVRAFVTAGKPVVAPAALFPGVKKITHIKDNGQTESGKLKLGKRHVSYIVLPGHQNETATTWVQCDHNVVTFPEGFTVAHIGDQAHSQDMPWIKKAWQSVSPVDILFSTAWMGKPENTVNGYKPRTVMTGHENEMGHTINGRVPFWFAYHNYRNVSCPVIIMGWGEKYVYRR